MIRLLIMLTAISTGEAPTGPQDRPREIMTERGLNLSWPMAGMAAAGLAYIIRSEMQSKSNAKNITALWQQVNKWKGSS